MTKLLTYDEHDLGLSWVIDEPMQRTSHALVDDGRVWLVDPVDVPEAVERARALGEPAAVLQLLDRHPRACAELAERFGVPHLRLPDAVPDSPFEVITVVDRPKWREKALWWPAARGLVVAEAVGTGPMFGDPAGIHLFLRLLPPGVLRDHDPEHLLVGHGSGVHGAAAKAALEHAYRRSRIDLPKTVVKLPFTMR
ncbi:MAG TPA: hypothetical protein VGW10_03140 [Solirubrobacteraceae bacterium]|nr:hypothetical protein [Solirubrobacteraceae bacterium]